MVVVHFVGGLGNQMFQYAFALWLSQKGLKVKADTSYYNRETSGQKTVDLVHNGFELPRVYGFPFEEATEQEIRRLSSNSPGFFHKVLRNTVGVKKSHIRLNGHEGRGWYYPEFASLDDHYFEGYWVSFQYADEIEECVRNAFAFKNTPSEQNRDTLEKIQRTNSVSVHIRHGDYLKVSDYYAVLSEDYYKRAIALIRQKVADPVFYCFSDDIDYCRETFRDENMVFIDWNKDDNSYWDLMLMSRCRHNIISNSTFSMWAGWLNENPEKIVIRPKQYYVHSKDEIAGLWPKEWTAQ